MSKLIVDLERNHLRRDHLLQIISLNKIQKEKALKNQNTVTESDNFNDNSDSNDDLLLPKNCPYWEFLWSAFLPHSD